MPASGFVAGGAGVEVEARAHCSTTPTELRPGFLIEDRGGSGIRLARGAAVRTAVGCAAGCEPITVRAAGGVLERPMNG